MAHRTNRSTSRALLSADGARAFVRALETMSSYACDYGAGGAALFDIVNVQIWTRRRAWARPQGCFHTGSGAVLLCQISCRLA